MEGLSEGTICLFGRLYRPTAPRHRIVMEGFASRRLDGRKPPPGSAGERRDGLDAPPVCRGASAHPLFYCALPAFMMAYGWGYRGTVGHEAGAMVPGALLGLPGLRTGGKVRACPPEAASFRPAADLAAGLWALPRGVTPGVSY